MNLPIFPEPRISFSGIRTLKECPRAYFLFGPGAWNGWYANAPEKIKERYAWKNCQGIFSWIGTLFHEWTTEVDFNEVDKKKSKLTCVPAVTDDELKERFWSRFDADWIQSERMTWEKWLTLKPRERKKINYFIQDALKLGTAEKLSRKKIENWINPSVENYLRYRREFLAEADFHDWLVIEGRIIKDGIIPDDGSGRSQALLRAERIHPTHEFDVKGEVWKFGYDMDRVVRYVDPVSEEEVYVILDFKTGKKKDSHFDQIMLYAALACLDLPELNEKKLFGQLSYTNYPPDEGVVRFPINSRDLKEGYDRAVDALNTLRSHLVRCKYVKPDVLRSILPRDLYADVESSQENWVFIEENFPPLAAKKLQVNTCKLCNSRMLCPDGLKLLSSLS